MVDFADSSTQKTIERASDFRIRSVQNDLGVANIAMINVTPNARSRPRANEQPKKR